MSLRPAGEGLRTLNCLVPDLRDSKSHVPSSCSGSRGVPATGGHRARGPGAEPGDDSGGTPAARVGRAPRHTRGDFHGVFPSSSCVPSPALLVGDVFLLRNIPQSPQPGVPMPEALNSATRGPFICHSSPRRRWGWGALRGQGDSSRKQPLRTNSNHPSHRKSTLPLSAIRSAISG